MRIDIITLLGLITVSAALPQAFNNAVDSDDTSDDTSEAIPVNSDDVRAWLNGTSDFHPGLNKRASRDGGVNGMYMCSQHGK